MRAANQYGNLAVLSWAEALWVGPNLHNASHERFNIDKIVTGVAGASFSILRNMSFFETLRTTPPCAMFVNNSELDPGTALRNSALQGAYMILAARVLGLDLRADVRL
jgi:hypothetical protein